LSIYHTMKRHLQPLDAFSGLLMHPKLGIPVYSDHAIAAYFAKMHISHIFPHIMAFSKFRIFIYAFKISIYA